MENMQPAGSFKLRGIGRVCEEAAKAGATRFISPSGGNAGYAAAWAGRELGVCTTVIVPVTTSEEAKKAIAALGAEVTVSGKSWKESNELALKMAGEDPKSKYIHAFDDPVMWDGHGTLVDEAANRGPGPMPSSSPWEGAACSPASWREWTGTAGAAYLSLHARRKELPPSPPPRPQGRSWNWRAYPPWPHPWERGQWPPVPSNCAGTTGSYPMWLPMKRPSLPAGGFSTTTGSSWSPHAESPSRPCTKTLPSSETPAPFSWWCAGASASAPRSSENWKRTWGFPAPDSLDTERPGGRFAGPYSFAHREAIAPQAPNNTEKNQKRRNNGLLFRRETISPKNNTHRTHPPY